MITAISGINQNKSQVGLSKKATSVAFKANLMKTSEKFLDSTGLQVGGKFKKMAEIMVNSVGRSVKKIMGASELPFAAKPLTANGEIIHFLPDGRPFSFEVPDSQIIKPGCDGANVYIKDANIISEQSAASSVTHEPHITHSEEHLNHSDFNNDFSGPEVHIDHDNLCDLI